VVFSSDLINELTKLYINFSKQRCMHRDEIPSELLEYLMGEGLIHLGINNNELCINSIVKLALELVKLGLDVEVISKPLNWRDFEELINEYLNLSGYHVIKNLRFTRRRYEVDVVGIDEVSGTAVVVDCKHWSPGYSKRGRLIYIAKEHRAKVEVLAENCASLLSKYKVLRKARILLPVIVTLTDAIRGYIGGSFIVPVLRFNDFISNARLYTDTLVGKSDIILNKCYS